CLGKDSSGVSKTMSMNMLRQNIGNYQENSKYNLITDSKDAINFL
ncbi:136_t:CDS:1, partial [Racocetra persica]